VPTEEVSADSYLQEVGASKFGKERVKKSCVKRLDRGGGKSGSMVEAEGAKLLREGEGAVGKSPFGGAGEVGLSKGRKNCAI